MKCIRKFQFFKISRQGNACGFTLMEVMIAMAIFAIGILGVATMQISSTNGNTSARKHSEASEIAQSQIEWLMAIPYANVAAGNDVTNGYPAQWTVVPVMQAGVQIGVQIQVVVTDPGGNPNSGSTLTVIRYAGI